MKKILTAILMLALISPSFAIFGIFEEPVTEINMEFVDTIPIAGYGFTGVNVQCSAFNFEIPKRQTSRITYVRLGYFPICDVNYTDYVQDITIFCAGEYVLTSNYTDNCVNGGFHESELVRFFHANITELGSGTNVITCQLCVNNTTTSNQTDFFVKIDNVGNRIVTEYRNETLFPQAQPLVDLIIVPVNFTVSVIELGFATFQAFALIWSIVAPLMFLLFMLTRLKKRLDQTRKEATR